MAKYKISTVSKYYEIFEVEASDEDAALAVVASGRATCVDSYGGGEDDIYDVEELDG